MQDKLIIYLEDLATELVSYAWTHAEGGVIQSHVCTQLSELASLGQNKEITLIVPAQDIVCTQVAMPKLSRARLLQALPYALEEHLLSDVQNLHFSVLAEEADGKTAVAIVAHQKMAAWIELFKLYHLSITTCIPDFLALPYTAQQWHVALYRDSAIVRTGLYSGFAYDRINLADLLILSLQEGVQQPESIQINNYTSSDLALEIEAITIKENKLDETQFIKDLCHFDFSQSFNLLQSTYRTKFKAVGSKRIWLLASYMTAAWIGFCFFSNLVSYVILHHQTNAVEAQIDMIYHHNFPQATAVVKPKERMTQKLNDLLTQGNKSPFLLWLGSVAKCLAEFKNIHIQQMDFTNLQLTLALAAPDFASLDKLATAMTKQSLNVKQQNVTTTGKTVKGNFIITGGKLS